MADPAAFAAQFGDLAASVGARIGVSPDVLLAQWGVESAWGASGLATRSNNLAGITRAGTPGDWAAYDSPAAFGDAFVSLVQRNFPGAIGAGGDANAYVAGLANGRVGSYFGDESAASYRAKVAGARASMGDTGFSFGDIWRFLAGGTLPAGSGVTPSASILAPKTAADIKPESVVPTLMTWGTNMIFVAFGLVVVAVVVAGGVKGRAA